MSCIIIMLSVNSEDKGVNFAALYTAFHSMEVQVILLHSFYC